MLPSGFTSAHLTLETLSLGVALYACNLTFWAYQYREPLLEVLDEDGGADPAVREAELEFASELFLYTAASILIVTGTAIATCSGCRASCCGCFSKNSCCGSQDATGHKAYLLAVVCALLLSLCEIWVLLGEHKKVHLGGKNQCDYGCGEPSTGSCTGLPAGTCVYYRNDLSPFASLSESLISEI